MIRRVRDADSEGAARAATVGVEALDHLGRLSGLVEYLLERRGGYPAPLDAWLSCGGKWSSPKPRAMWDRVVGAIVLTGEMLGRALPATEEGRDHQVGAELIIRWLQDGVEETLKDLWDYWPHVRDDLLRYVRLQVRRDDPKDVRPIDGAARACGLAVQTPPASARLAPVFRGVLVELILCAGTEVTRAELRQLLARVAGIRGPRRARYAMARALATYAGRDQDRRIEDDAFLGDPGRSPPPPAALVDRALLLLGAADVSEAGGTPGLLWRGRSAYGVLRRTATKPVWVDDLRDAADAVLAGSIEIEDLVALVEAPIEPPPRVETTDTTGPSIRAAAQRNAETDERAKAVDSPAPRASDRVEGSVATGGVSSPPPPSGQASAEPAEPLVETSRSSGDETDARKPASGAGLGEVSSPALPAKNLAAGGPACPDSVGGDGTETSQAAPRSEPAGVSSLAAPAASAVPPTTRGAVRLFAFKESLETPFGAPRESGRVTANLVREGQPPELVQVSRAQYESMVDLARKRVLAFQPNETGQRARNRLRERLGSWGVRTSVPARAAGAGQAHVLRLEGHFTVHLADGSPDRTAAARRLVREARRQRFLGQD
ncbi:MAG: hypothetical protein IT460_04145 [Planctomycetes bacterium]|nr:hypothetical protein [Planctomycetota bacterium]